MAKVARKILQTAKVAKKLPSNLWPRLGKIRFLDVAHFKIQMFTNLTIHSAFCFAFFQGLVMKYRLEMTNEKDAPDQCKYRLAWVKSFNHKSEQEAEATTSATATRTAKNPVGLDWQTTTLHVHHVFLYISLPSLHDYDVKVPNFSFCGGR